MGSFNLTLKKEKKKGLWLDAGLVQGVSWGKTAREGKKGGIFPNQAMRVWGEGECRFHFVQKIAKIGKKRNVIN